MCRRTANLQVLTPIEKSSIAALTSSCYGAIPHFRPLHFQAAIEGGKHVFTEKSVAVDAPGVRSVLETSWLAKERNLSVVSGLCLRFSKGFQGNGFAPSGRGDWGYSYTASQRLSGENMGKIPSTGLDGYALANAQLVLFHMVVPVISMSNNHVHYLDICSWIMKNTYPVCVVGIGGRQVRTGEEYGNIYDHHSVTYEYENGTKLFSNCRQMPGCHNDMSAQAVGSNGKANLNESKNGLYIINDTKWTYSGEDNDFYQTEHDELFASIRNGKSINNGEYMAKSTMLAIMGRMATYTGQRITWNEAFNSKEDLTPPKYEWGPIEIPQVAMPGITKFY